jgi:hypothetical protein
VPDLGQVQAEHVAAEAGQRATGAEAEQAGSDNHEFPTSMFIHIYYNMRRISRSQEPGGRPGRKESPVAITQSPFAAVPARER